MPLEHEALTERIIGAAIEVHRRLGPGFLESVYEKALVVELKKRGLAVERQVEIIVYYAGVEVGRHVLDLFVENTIVVELKAIKNLEDVHFAIVRSYLKAADRKHGLLLNFAKICAGNQASHCSLIRIVPAFLPSLELRNLSVGTDRYTRWRLILGRQANQGLCQMASRQSLLDADQANLDEALGQIYGGEAEGGTPSSAAPVWVVPRCAWPSGSAISAAISPRTSSPSSSATPSRKRVSSSSSSSRKRSAR